MTQVMVANLEVCSKTQTHGFVLPNRICNCRRTLDPSALGAFGMTWARRGQPAG